jgi:opacity protein-like surface antigen
MRRAPLLFGAVLAACPLSAARADDYPPRPFHAGITAGARTFEKRLDLQPDIAVGLRVGLGLERRVSVLLDCVHTTPVRKTTGRLSHITGLRALVQYRLLTSQVRPYLLAGVGGILFDFDDTYDTATGALTGGGGIEVRLARQVQVFGEASADFYRYRTVIYSATGNLVSSSERSTDTAAAYLAGITVNF